MIISQSKDLAGLTRRENSLTLDCFLPATHRLLGLGWIIWWHLHTQQDSKCLGCFPLLWPQHRWCLCSSENLPGTSCPVFTQIHSSVNWNSAKSMLQRHTRFLTSTQAVIELCIGSRFLPVEEWFADTKTFGAFWKTLLKWKSKKKKKKKQAD